MFIWRILISCKCRFEYFLVQGFTDPGLCLEKLLVNSAKARGSQKIIISSLLLKRDESIRVILQGSNILFIILLLFVFVLQT